MTRDSVRDEIAKRLTMNWLIQGASQHVGMTLHHLIHDELRAIHPELPLWYDQLALINQLQWWRPVQALLFGWPPMNWWKARHSPLHPFRGHPLLARYGGAMAQASRGRAIERARTKGVWRWPLTFSMQTTLLISRLANCERRSPELVKQAAIRAASLAWGIDASRFRPELRFSVSAVPPFAPVRFPRSIRALFFHAGAIAWGGVSRDADGALCVRATAGNGYYLSKELVKGTAELICLHGLVRLDDSTYEQVMRATDRIDFEPAMLQSGGELWRRLLHAIPQSIRPADVLMQLALASHDTVVDVLTSVIKESSRAEAQIRALCQT